MPNYLRSLLAYGEPVKNHLRGLLGAVQDPEFYMGMLENTRQVGGGLLAGTLGAPVDIATMAMRPLGYQTPDKQVMGSSEQIAGLLGLDTESTPYKVGSLLPTDVGDAMKYAGLLGAVDTRPFGEALALASPNGRMSKAALERAQERIRQDLFGPNGLQKPDVVQPPEVERLLQQAQELRGLAARGMKPRAYTKRAEELEAQAAALSAK